ncbi:hypothetical protein K491DRAFT_692279 [Lophiostoma macrostomum CBS 122681]|uniref:Uncharacterized protein n=1 Tax=Lophiostoma macrostomum CBS 122681 TaxID=1314788 RepID=A0A6A6T7X3_9PLEO|nr:hypothetical protein K491DRAFT_692279 [Lophiostoma macrostomum CBS 122681]
MQPLNSLGNNTSVTSRLPNQKALGRVRQADPDRLRLYSRKRMLLHRPQPMVPITDAITLGCCLAFCLLILASDYHMC